MVWYPTVDDLAVIKNYYGASILLGVRFPSFGGSGSYDYDYQLQNIAYLDSNNLSRFGSDYSVIYNGDGRSWTVDFNIRYDVSCYLGIDSKYSEPYFLAPVSGRYSVLEMPCISGSVSNQAGIDFSLTRSYTAYSINYSNFAEAKIEREQAKYAV